MLRETVDKTLRKARKLRLREKLHSGTVNPDVGHRLKGYNAGGCDVSEIHSDSNNQMVDHTIHGMSHQWDPASIVLIALTGTESTILTANYLNGLQPASLLALDDAIPPGTPCLSSETPIAVSMMNVDETAQSLCAYPYLGSKAQALCTDLTFTGGASAMYSDMIYGSKMPSMYNDAVSGSKAPLMYSDTAPGPMFQIGESHAQFSMGNI